MPTNATQPDEEPPTLRGRITKMIHAGDTVMKDKSCEEIQNLPTNAAEESHEETTYITDAHNEEDISTRGTDVKQSLWHIRTDNSQGREERRALVRIARADDVPYSASHATSAADSVSGIGHAPVTPHTEVRADAEHCSDLYVFMFSAHSYDCVAACS